MIAPVLPTYARANLSFERGEGARVYTPEGEEYLDFGAGVAVTSCGHAHPHRLMLGIKCRIPNSELQAAAMHQRLLTIAAGDNVLRLLPPLIVTEADVAGAVHRLDQACRVLEAKAA